MDMQEILENFGLTDAEAKLYLELLTKAEATASELAKSTDTNRTFTYDRLKKLITTGLASYTIKDNKKYFRAADPEHLLSILRDREAQISNILPKLKALRQMEENTPQVEVFSSKKGIRTVLNSLLRQKKEILIHGSIKLFKRSMEGYFNIWNQRRADAKIEAKILTTEDIELPLSKVELLNEEETSSITTFTTDNTTVIALWSQTPLAMLIESPEIAKENSIFFKNLWNREIRIYSGVEGIKRAWMELISKGAEYVRGYGFSWTLAQIYGRDLSDRWHKARLEHSIPAKIISYDNEKSRKYFDMRGMEKKEFKIRFLDEDVCGPSCIALSKKLLVQFLYTEKKYKVVVSRNKEMINVHKKHFEKLWNRAN